MNKVERVLRYMLAAQTQAKKEIDCSSTEAMMAAGVIVVNLARNIEMMKLSELLSVMTEMWRDNERAMALVEQVKSGGERTKPS